MYVSVLGPLQVRNDDGENIPVAGARLRVLLTRLALDPGRPVPADTLVHAIWERDEPGGAANALQSLVSRLRRMLGAATVTSGPAGYALALDASAVDAHRFEASAARGRRLLAADDPAAAEHALTEALGLWRGAALADAADAAFALGPATRLEEQRLTATEDRVDARLRLGRAADVVPELEQLAAEHPVRERLHAQLMTALDTVGRRADALAAYQALRTHLADELGIDPSPELDAVHVAILRGERRTPRKPVGGAGEAGARVTAPHGERGSEASGGGGTTRDVRDAAHPHRPVPTAADDARTHTSPGPEASAPNTADPATSPGFAPEPPPSSPPTPRSAPMPPPVDAPRHRASRRPDTRASASGSPASPAVGPPPAQPRSAEPYATDAPAAFHPADVPAAPRTPPVTNLTARLTSFVGRDGDRVRLADTLRRARLVSVVGPGGAGKTRITVETGAGLLPEFPGGVWFVELASVHEPDDIPQAVLAALGRREIGIITSPRVETQAGAVTGHDALVRIGEMLAARRPTLLILDNCEHLVASAAEAAEALLAGAPTLRILASTREPLGIDGEVLYPLGPLPLPSDTGDVAAALESPAVRLFADRAHAVRPNLVIDAANIGAVTEICRRLDGMPLAIELAAARTRSLTPTQIARRLDDRFRLLTGRNRTAMPRHQTLRAVVGWSWDLLDDRERTLLRRLSVFAGGATLEAAETVLADPDGELVGGDDVLDLLAGLVDKSLVDMFGTGEPRYRMLETIAAFAAERRDDAGADAGVARRHLAWCLELLERTDPLLRTGGQLDALAAIAEEHDNIAVALRFALDHGDARSAVRLVALMGWYWAVRGYHREAAAWLGDALALPTAPAPDAAAPDAAARDAESRALAQWFLGITLISSGRDPEGLRALMRGRWALRRLSPNPANPLVELVAVMSAALRDFTSGTTDALDAVGEHSDPWIRAVVDLISGHLAINVGRGPDGLRHLGRARARFLEIGDRWGRSSATAGLAEVYRYAGRFEEGVAALDECLELVGELGSVEDVPLLLSRRGVLRLRLGDHEGARADMHAALDVAGEGDTAGGVVLAHAWAGDLARYLGDHEEAERQYARAVAELPKNRSAQPQLVACLHLSLAYSADMPAARGKARLALDSAVAAAVDGRDMPIVASVSEGLAWYAFQSGDPERAAELLGVAVALRGYRDLGSLDAERLTGQVRAALGALSDDAYDKAFARGAALSQAEALDVLRRS
ncbi:winged helix-turn-helix domain-containing protein [Yinghuangia sp. ASG 101]|uniref:AfsR/SARP family transcriptional regulator n=1 Tax=Yinghuangia sp. ASG 101 TaxID=2896848 RepID=UPI001E509DE2|nr:BTAD domain-containing putative transcriptional regulator [Yinghuangia sp. ASG 101]UGQ13736.1 winged helix-turn-helix domain-containing protein [Yinghuangia sp. ASG 101]